MTLQAPISYSGNPVRVTVSPEVGTSRRKIITPTGTGLTTLGALKRRAEEIALSWRDVHSAKSTDYFDGISRQWTPFDATE